jgi:hypothetical protein
VGVGQPIQFARVAGDEVWVDGSTADPVRDGSFAHPFKELAAGVASLIEGLLHLSPGTYEAVSIAKQGFSTASITVLPSQSAFSVQLRGNFTAVGSVTLRSMIYRDGTILANGGRLVLEDMELYGGVSSQMPLIQAGNMSVELVGCNVHDCYQLYSGRSPELTLANTSFHAVSGLRAVALQQTYAGRSSTVEVTRCRFTDNAAAFIEIGRTSAAGPVQATVSDTLVARNTATGALFGGELAALELHNCTLTSNSSLLLFAGLSNYYSVRNTIIYANVIGRWTWSGLASSHVRIAHSDIDDSLAGWATDQGGNISQDPRFFDSADGDYRLSYGSPCLDAGSAAYASPTDLDGNPRAGMPDMGAYEGGHSHAPQLMTPLIDQSTGVGRAFTYQFAADSFSDPDSDPLSYTTRLQGGGALPGWLSFDSASRTFSGTPTEIGTLEIVVTASDPYGASCEGNFALDVSVSPPTVNRPIPNQVGEAGKLFTFALAADTFVDLEGDALTLTATLSDGSPLPLWLGFVGATATFSGVPPHVGTLVVKLVATDTHGESCSASFSLVVGGFARGDVDGDGVITSLDARLALAVADCGDAASAEQHAAADVDADGDVDMDDVRILSEFVLGMRATLP